jgi:hypothetical protein
MTITMQTFDHGAAPTDGAPLIANFGGGFDSTAFLIGLVQRGIRPDLILFADTGAERPETYDHVIRFSSWLVAQGFPAVTTVSRHGELAQYGPKSRASKTGSGYTDILGNCLQNETLPSEAFGRGGCSVKWKHEPMDAFLATHPLIVEARERGLVPVKMVGFNCGPADSKRKAPLEGEAAAKKPKHQGGFRFWYPLQSWGWDRERCVAEVKAAGFSACVKSSCFFCPNMTEAELLDLHTEHPALFRKAIAVEDGARKGRHGLRIEGMWRRTRKSDGRPGSWRVWAEDRGLIERDPTVREHVAQVQGARSSKRKAA